MSRWTVLILLGVIVGTLTLGAMLWFFLSRPVAPVPDALLLRAFANVPGITAYSQMVETEAEIAERTLKVVGVYHVDRENLRFASSATTTLTIPGETTAQVFNVSNIVVGDDVFVKIETADESLRDRIPHSPDWRHFPREQIPTTFADIAAKGPILDNLLLFNENGAYLRLVENIGNARWNDEELVRYRFVIADDAPREVGGTLQTLLERISDGGIDVWVDPESADIRHLVIMSPEYRSTTTFANPNHIPPIEAPSLTTD